MSHTEVDEPQLGSSSPLIATSSAEGPTTSHDDEDGVETSRERQLTEKGFLWQVSLRERKIKSALSAWHRCANQLEETLSDSNQVLVVKSGRDALREAMQQLSKANLQLEELQAEEYWNSELALKYERIEEENHLLVRRSCQRIADIEESLHETRSRMSDKRSHSRQSMSSKGSSTLNRATIAAEAAALKAKLKFADLEASKRAELELKKAELEQLNTMKDLHAAEATLEVIDQAQEQHLFGSQGSLASIPEKEKNAIVEDYLKTHGALESPNNDANDIAPASNVPGTEGDRPSPCKLTTSAQVPVTETNASGSEQQLIDFTKSLAKQLCISRLPPPEPGVFVGDPLKYPNWKRAFETLIEQRGIPQSEQLYYLKKYTGGAAREAIEGYFFLTTNDAYDQAKKLLEKRYGDPFVIANAFRDKLDSWPKVPPRDGIALRNFADFLRQCETATKSIGTLDVLNDERENRKMLSKLPDWLVSRWARKVADKKEHDGKFPPFCEFAKLIEKEANIACDPVTTLQGLKGNDKRQESFELRGKLDRSSRKRGPGANSFSTRVDESPSKGQKGNFEQQPKECALCNKGHHLDVCPIFLSKDMTDRKEFVKKRGLCFGCLSKGHMAKYCRRRLNCKTCSKRHPTSLHGDTKEETKTTGNSSADAAQWEHKPVSSNTRTSFLSEVRGSSQCSMTVPVWVSHCDRPEHEQLVYALLDTQSDTTFILEDTCDTLGLDGPTVQLLLSTMTAKDQKVASRKISGLFVRAYDGVTKIPLPAAYCREVIPANRDHIPTADMARKWPHLEGIADHLMPATDCEVGLLIGYNCPRALAPREVIHPTDGGPYGQRTDLGWSIVGIVKPGSGEDEEDDPIGISHKIVTYSVHPLLDQSANKQLILSIRNKVKEITPVEFLQMMELDFPERKPDDGSLSQDDIQFLTKIRNGIHNREDGHYEMPLPFRGSEPDLPNSKLMAQRRLDLLKTRFKKNPKYHSDYTKFVEDIISKNHAEKVPDSDVNKSSGVWYIPHHGVYHPKKPEKIRVVFDCSAQYKGESLNDHLLQGPDLINSLVGILCRFRLQPIAFMCDVEQMFHQFKVDPGHRDYLRFLWWKNGNYNSEHTEYRMGVHLFGAVSSPGCANFGLKQIAEDNEAMCGSEAADFVRRDFYVDDGLKSVPSASEAVTLIRHTKNMCAQGGLRLHKFISNSRDVMESIPEEDRASNLKDLDLLHDALPIERALGVEWCVESDTFNFRITLRDKPLTRRGILSTISSIYDPLGLVAPVMLKGRLILQDLCRIRTDWDSPLTDEMRSRWEQWRKELPLLEKLKIPRCVRPEGFGKVMATEIHHFSDASTFAYAQCSYLRLIDDKDNVHNTLIMGKSRVTPLKSITIPRLELTAAVVSVRVATLLHKELPLDVTTEVFWTDSKVVLGYVKNESRRFHVFVANRVQQIRNRSSPGQWRHVGSKENPADEGSRGLSVAEIVSTSKWLTGPDFLMEKELPPQESSPYQTRPNDPEVKRTQSHLLQSTPMGIDFDRFSEWHSVKRAVAGCQKYITCLKMAVSNKHRENRETDKPPQHTPASVEDLNRAEQVVIRLVQKEAFPEERKILASLRIKDGNTDRQLARKRNASMKCTSSLFRLDPFIDSEGIMRVGGRIRKADMSYGFKHPAILPRKHHITDLIVRQFHEKAAHQGRSMTTNTIRSNGFWVLGCSAAVSTQISKCVKCRKWYGRAQEQQMANLPEERLQPAPPFTYCGVDYFGPWLIKEGRKEMKRYGVIFTCLSSRAIHIEVANSLTTDAFINALRRFMAIRGPIRVLRSDQGTNLVGARSELKRSLDEMDHDKVRHYLTKTGCDYPEFKMNAPTASHAGGVWERLIRSVRRVLQALMEHAGTQLDDESLRTFMCEAMSIVNSRPLTVDSVNEATALEPLTPNQLLTMKSNVVVPPPGEFQRVDVYSQKRWRRVQYLANEFWKRWKGEFIQTLQTRQKWARRIPSLRVGDIVLIVDNLPRNHWKLGRISEVIPSSDGQVRRVKLVVADASLDDKGRRTRPVTCLERPIQKLVLLLESQEHRVVPLEEP